MKNKFSRNSCNKSNNNNKPCTIINFNEKNIEEINGNYYINKALLYNDDKGNIKFSYSRKLKIAGFDSRKNNQHFIEEYNKSIKQYCDSYDFELIYENNSDKLPSFTAHKLVIGFGNPSVLEKSITLHHIYGIPYIPGQVIKGSMRTYFLSRYYDIEYGKFKDEDGDKSFNLEKLYKFIFGDNLEDDDSMKGGIIFFDTFPKLRDNSELKQDIMTPHYNDYYANGNEPHRLPKDDKSPMPNVYHVLDGESFDFLIAIDKKKYDVYRRNCLQSGVSSIELDELKKFIMELMKSTLSEQGLGAKTAVGNGRFTYNDKTILNDNKIALSETKQLTNNNSQVAPEEMLKKLRDTINSRR